MNESTDIAVDLLVEKDALLGRHYTVTVTNSGGPASDLHMVQVATSPPDAFHIAGYLFNRWDFATLDAAHVMLVSGKQYTGVIKTNPIEYLADTLENALWNAKLAVTRERRSWVNPHTDPIWSQLRLMMPTGQALFIEERFATWEGSAGRLWQESVNQEP